MSNSRLIVGLVAGCLAAAGPVLRAGEPIDGQTDESRPVVLVHASTAERWLAILGADLVTVQRLVPDKSADDRWAASVAAAAWRPLPQAFVWSAESDDLLPRFWSERLQHQGALEVLQIDATRCPAPRSGDEAHLCQIHDLLVKLCPAARGELAQRLQQELQRGQQRGPQVVPLASR
jgi:type II secretory pathway component PulL